MSSLTLRSTTLEISLVKLGFVVGVVEVWETVVVVGQIDERSGRGVGC